MKKMVSVRNLKKGDYITLTGWYDHVSKIVTILEQGESRKIILESGMRKHLRKDSKIRTYNNYKEN